AVPDQGCTGHRDAVANPASFWHRWPTPPAIKPPYMWAKPELGCGCSSGVEHNLAKVGVEGSNPFARSKFTLLSRVATHSRIDEFGGAGRTVRYSSRVRLADAGDATQLGPI